MGDMRANWRIAIARIYVLEVKGAAPLAARAMTREMLEKTLKHMKLRAAAQTFSRRDSRFRRVSVVMDVSTMRVQTGTRSKHRGAMGAMELNSRGTRLVTSYNLESSRVLSNAH